MTKWMMPVIGILMIGLPLTIEAADNKAPAKKPADKAQEAVQTRSNVPQSTVEIVKKREAARKQRDKKLNVRTRNVNKSPKTDSNELFRRSK